MESVKSRTISADDRADTGRRSFIWKAGVTASAALAAAVPGMSSHSSHENDASAEAKRLADKLGMLEDEKSIRALHQKYEILLDGGKYENVLGLFAESAAVVFGGKVFKGRDGISQLYCDRFSSGMTGRKIGTAPGFAIDAVQHPESIAVSADRMSATARFHYSIQVGIPMTSESQLVQMARLQGEGIRKWCEGGIYEVSYVKDTRDGSWKISRLEHRIMSQTDYRPGRTYANPISKV